MQTSARVSLAATPLDLVARLLSVTFVLFLPLLIIGTSLRALVTDRDLVLQGFRENSVARTTGLDDPQLQRIADTFVAYFQGPPGQIQMQVTAFGQQRLLFNDREVTHMEDVQAVIQMFLKLQVIAIAVVAVRAILAATVERSTVPIGRDMLISAALMVLLVIVVGVLSLVDFEALWTRFHQIAFRNDLWLLDPRTDYLIMLFPEPFWFTATIRMALSVALQTLGAILLGALLVFGPLRR
ncbi:MAG: hypothetical protein NVSMB2_22470 [Chloroflexota bacterium]